MIINIATYAIGILVILYVFKRLIVKLIKQESTRKLNDENLSNIMEKGDPIKALQLISEGNIVEIQIVTNDQGPIKDDVFWRIRTNENEEIVISQANKISESILIESQKLPKFDNGELIRSMSSTDNKIFCLWKNNKSAQQSDASETMT